MYCLLFFAAAFVPPGTQELAPPPLPAELLVQNVIPAEGTEWATVVRDPRFGKVVVIDNVRMPNRNAPEISEGETHITLNRGIPEKLSIAAADLAPLAAANVVRTRRTKALDADDDRVRIVEGPGPWTLFVTAAETLTAASAAERNAALAGALPGAKTKWATGDLRLEINPVALATVAAFPPEAYGLPRVETTGGAQIQWGGRHPEVWRLRGGAWAPVRAGEPHFFVYSDY